MDSLVITPVDYGKLDHSANAVRLRLNAPVVAVDQAGGTDAQIGALDYVDRGKLKSVTAGHVVLACWHRVIPHILAGLRPDQVHALNDQQKVPLILANVLIRNWEASRGSASVALSRLAPGTARRSISPSAWAITFLRQNPSEPVLVNLLKVPQAAIKGVSPREQSLAGRRRLAQLTFEEMEFEIRDYLGRALTGGGFDPASDIEAITINRWAHGYTREYMRPWDMFWPDGPLPIETARQRSGRVAIANADSGAYAYAHSAIDQAARAVRDLLGHSKGLPIYADFPGPPRDMLGLE